MHREIFITVVVIVSLLSVIVITVAVGAYIRKKTMGRFVLAVNDDRAQICETETKSRRKVGKRPTHNQVVDLATIENSVFVGDQ